MECKKGHENQAADALPRVVIREQLNAVTMAVPVWIIEVLNSYERDEYYKKLIMKLIVDPQAELNYTLNVEILRYKNRIVVGANSELTQQLIMSCHTSTLGGHSRERATYQRLKLLFHWVGLKQAVISFVKECPICQKNKSEHTPYPGLLQPLPVPEKSWTHISVDFIEGLPKSEGKEVILVIVDRFTKYSHFFFAMSHQFIVQQVAHEFLDGVYKLHGLLAVIVSDRDRIFTNHLWQELFKSLGVKLRFSTSYHPQTDGQTERVNQFLEGYLKCMSFASPKKWKNWLSLAEWWYNTSYHTSLEMTPFQALYSFSPLIKAQERINKYANKKRTEREFAVGDMAYLKIQPYRHTSLNLHRSLKLHPKFYGPFRVMENIGQVAYKLLLPNGCQLHPMFHVSQLKKHLGSKVIPSPELPLVDNEGNLKVYPAAILERRVVPRNNEPIIQWLIQWINLPHEAATWEDTDFIAKVFPDFHS